MGKCQVCSKKSLITVICKCGQILCLKHRDATSHTCTYDYKKEFENKLEKENPKLLSKKIEKI